MRPQLHLEGVAPPVAEPPELLSRLRAWELGGIGRWVVAGECALPLTAVRCVKRVYTDLAVLDVTPAGMVVREMLTGLSEADLRARTGAPLAFAPDCRPLVTPAIALPD